MAIWWDSFIACPFGPLPHLQTESKCKSSALKPVGVTVSFFCIGITGDVWWGWWGDGMEGGQEPEANSLNEDETR